VGGLVAGPAGWGARMERTGLRPAETKLRQRVEGASADFEDLGLNHLWAEKGRRRNFLFIFRKHFREKQNNLEIAR
jgi:hypothetical protein